MSETHTKLVKEWADSKVTILLLRDLARSQDYILRKIGKRLEAATDLDDLRQEINQDIVALMERTHSARELIKAEEPKITWNHRDIGKVPVKKVHRDWFEESQAYDWE